MFDLIAFDADDTLWHNESLYAETQERFRQLLARYASPEQAQQALDAAEARNLALFGYGIKGFTLSMIEAAIAVSGGRIPAEEVGQIVGFAKDMIETNVRLLEGAAETVAQLAAAYDLMLITKGDLLDQERKVARSGIGHHFRHVEIVSDKTADTYASLLTKHSLEPARFLMVGNSLRSDVLPVLALGGHAVYIPYHITWSHEAVTPQAADGDYYELEHIGLLPALLERLGGR